MLLTKIILQDYGVYRGKNEFDLECTPDMPIILIGGANGAGKTTFFESVMLCLYGASAIGRRCTKKTYEQFLSKKIHRYSKRSTQANSASITVQFRFFHAGAETEFRVNRTWRRTGGGLEERLFVHKRHAGASQFLPLDIVEESYWQAFIKDLVPRGVANLFFFDGEKIAKIAEEDDFAIKESFKSILGLDIVEQLRTDLQVNMMRNLTKDGGALEESYEKHKAEKDEYGTSNAKMGERLAQKQNELDRLQVRMEAIEDDMSKIGGEFTSKIESVKEVLVAKKTEYSHIEKKIQENCSGHLPFSMIPDKLDAVKATIEQDQEILRGRLGIKATMSEIGCIKSIIGSDDFWNDLSLDDKDAKDVREKMLSLLDKRMAVPKEVRNERFGFSSSQIAKILAVIYGANSSALDNLSSDTQKLVVLAEDIQKMERTLASAASDDEIGQMVSSLRDLNRKSVDVQAEMNHIEEKISSNAAMCAHIDAKLREIMAQMYRDERSKTQVRLTQEVQAVLDKFFKEIKASKTKLLEQYLFDNIQILMQKKQLVEKVEIDPDTFEVGLFGAGGHKIEKDTLSKGEQQMLATSILWALAKTSGKSLPFMIDTPLARLDEEHRANVIERFLPMASHQTVIFSTNKEIEYEYYKLLQPYVARSYVVEFSTSEESTRCRSGYFWNEGGEKAAALQ